MFSTFMRQPARLQELRFPTEPLGGVQKLWKKLYKVRIGGIASLGKGEEVIRGISWILCTLGSPTPTPTKAPMMTMQAVSFAHPLIGRSRILSQVYGD